MVRINQSSYGYKSKTKILQFLIIRKTIHLTSTPVLLFPRIENGNGLTFKD